MLKIFTILEKIGGEKRQLNTARLSHPNMLNITQCFVLTQYMRLCCLMVKLKHHLVFSRSLLRTVIQLQPTGSLGVTALPASPLHRLL